MNEYIDKIVSKDEAELLNVVLGCETFEYPEYDDNWMASELTPKKRAVAIADIKNHLELQGWLDCKGHAEQPSDGFVLRVPNNSWVIEHLLWWVDWIADDTPAFHPSAKSIRAKLLDVCS